MRTGSYTLDAGAVVQHRGDRNFKLPDPLFLGLMTVPPHPEGEGGVELSAAGYQRAPIQFGTASPRVVGGTMVNLYPVVFRPNEGWDGVLYAAIFDEHGKVFFYGRLWRQSSGSDGGLATIPASSIRLRFHQAAQ
jgi:hypothetical protein